MRVLLALLSLASLTMATAAQPPLRRQGVPPRKGVLRPAMARQLLRRALEAEKNYPYVAREMVTGRDGQTIEQWVKSDPRRGVRRESIKPEGELMVDNFTRSFRLSRRDRGFQEMGSLLADTNKRYQDALRLVGIALQVELQGQDTVAGRTADILLVQPMAGRTAPSRRIWVDRETGLRLRIEERDADGRILSNSYFLSLELNPTFRDEDFARPAIPTGFRRLAEPQRKFATVDEATRAGFPPRLPQWLPNGFVLRAILVSEDAHRLTCQWGNGLSVISLVQVTGPPPPVFRRTLGRQEKGFVSLPRGERVYAWRWERGYFLLLGGLPDDQIQRIADSVK